MKSILASIFRRRREAVIVVSGLPRSGTSLVMQMLVAGGLEPFTDAARKADEDNPKGYYEHERVKGLGSQADKTWVNQAAGKVIKVISNLLTDLPPENRYRVIFVRRNLDEIIASQNKMLERRQESLAQDDRRTRELFEAHLARISNWIRCQPNFEVVEIAYSEIIASPGEAAERIRRFIDRDLDVEQMSKVVDPALYRNRKRQAEGLP